jgi:Zn-dependent protease with chaperone function
MDYKPSQPTSNVNVSDKHPLREFGELLAGLLVLLLLVYIVLGFLVDFTIDHISTDTEISINEALKTEGFSYLFSEEDGAADALAEPQAILDQLLPCARLPYQVTLHLMDKPEINAFALPGGTMGINRGLINQVDTKMGMAFVLAHELGHFKNRDHLRSLGRGIVLLSGSVILTGGNTDLAAILNPSIGLQIAQYSQDRELQADNTALDLLYCAYGTTEGATELFEHMLQLETDSLLGHYFRSHPQTRTRIQAINKAALDRSQ